MADNKVLFDGLERAYGDLPTPDDLGGDALWEEDDLDLLDDYTRGYEAIAAAYSEFAARHGFAPLY